MSATRRAAVQALLRGLGPRAQSNPITSRLIWLRVTDALARLFWLGVLAATLVLAVSWVPTWLIFSPDFQDTAVYAQLPESWPLSEVTLPEGVTRTRLPSEYWRYTPRYAIDGERWEDPLNYGKFPLLWAVAFRSEELPEVVYRHYLRSLRGPLYRLRDIYRTPMQTDFVFVYCDGDTFIHLIGPGPYSEDNRYLLRILVYDH